MRREINRAVAYFDHDGERYKIHERTNYTTGGVRFTRRFILRRADDSYQGHLPTAIGGVREARATLDARKP